MLKRCTTAGLFVSVIASVGGAQQGQGETPSQFPLSHTIRETGSSITGAYEGWYKNQDGSISLLVGYFNRNTKQELDIPIGPSNKIEPGGPDQGQPTHFEPGRHWGVFVVKAPADLGNKKLTWTLVANGQTNTITLHTKPEWVIEPFEDPASKNTPPAVKFQQNGSGHSGPPTGIEATFAATTQSPLTITAWATDEPAKLNVANAALAPTRTGTTQPPVLTWHLVRGPAAVKFDSARPSVNAAEGGKATTAATFGAPGEYLLRLQANDQSGDGGGGFQCCWTNAIVKVTVK